MKKLSRVYAEIAVLIKDRCGIDLSENKYALIDTRLKRRIESLGLTSLEDYYKVILADREELKNCIEALTTHKTEWFREIVHFQWLKEEIKKCKGSGRTIYIWSAASSSGEEAYSILFLLLREGFKHHQFRILATDISERVLDKARRLPARQEFMEQVDFLLSRSPNPEVLELELRLALEKSIKFRLHNLVGGVIDANLAFDFIFLRNVLIYFDHDTIRAVCKSLLSQLDKHGHLIIGLAESIQEIVPEVKHIGNSIYCLQSSNRREFAKVSPVGVTHPVNSKTKILIVEDSVPVTKILSKVYSQLANAEIVGVTGSVREAVDLLHLYKPNFVSLDMNLEDGTGLDFLQKSDFENWSKVHKSRCILVTDCSKSEGHLVLDSFSMGVSEYFQKPQMNSMSEFSDRLSDLLQSFVGGRNLSEVSIGLNGRMEKRTGFNFANLEIVVIGSSTGGTEVVRDLIALLPSDFPPIVVVQHMPTEFTGLYADRIGRQTGRPTFEISSRMELKRGSAYIAAGGTHAVVDVTSGGVLIARPIQKEPVNRFKPSVSVLFESVVQANISSRSLSIMLTGMGRDGANEMLLLKNGGGFTMGQSEESCVVYGMPRAAAELGALLFVGSPGDMVSYITKALRP
jgi:two-component system, chemotaxis family, protein-glutamate methylesterase/glutaminase